MRGYILKTTREGHELTYSDISTGTIVTSFRLGEKVRDDNAVQEINDLLNKYAKLNEKSLNFGGKNLEIRLEG